MTDDPGSAAGDERAADGASVEVVEVVDEPGAQRFEIHVDGALAGFAEYQDRPGNVRSMPHTEVASAYQGRGLAQRLIRAALDAARAAHLSVLPYCPAVRGFIAKHRDYLDLVSPDRRAEFDLG